VSPPGAGADGDHSGTIDPADLVIWEAHYGASLAPPRGAADFDQNQQIDGNDFLFWQRRLGLTYPYPNAIGSYDVDFSSANDAGDLEVWKQQVAHNLGLAATASNSASAAIAMTAASAPAVALASAAAEEPLSAMANVADGPAIAANVILTLELNGNAAADFRPNLVRRPTYRPAHPAFAARDAALAALAAGPAAFSRPQLLLGDEEGDASDGELKESELQQLATAAVDRSIASIGR